MSKRLDIFEYAEQHKDCPEHTNEYEINDKKFIVHSHFVGKKNIDKVLHDIALNRAMSEVLNGEHKTTTDIDKDKNTMKNIVDIA